MITQIPEYRSPDQANASEDSARKGLHRTAVTLVLALALLALWFLMHRYQGLASDAQIYAFQALARIHPALAADLYLQNTSQDQYTVFSPIYASFIGLFGLEDAARLLTMFFTAWFLVAAWYLARTLSSRDTAWLAVAFLVITSGEYGAFSVFRFSEQYLTARLPAEALIVTALFCHFRGLKRLALLMAMGALLFHPLMAFPGFLLLVCMWLPGRMALAGAVAGVLIALCIAGAATTIPAAARIIPVMDPVWLEIVRERSQFLFLQLWSPHDWELNARPFISLAITTMAVPDERIRKLSARAMIVGGTGLAVASIASMIGPVAILLQGQAWRWVWITCFAAALLLPVTVFEVWRDEKCGPICGILLMSAWTFSVVDSTACLALASLLWLVRAHVTARTAQYLRWAAAALGIVIVAWIFANSWTIISSAPPESGRGPALIVKLRDIFGLQISALLLIWLVWQWVRTTRSLTALTVVCVLLAASCAFILPGSLNYLRSVGSAAEIKEFADWQRVIPATSSVLIAPPQDSGSFVWFTLHRADYLSIDQSAGVVFSRATALEIKRRSQVLLPVADPDWKLLSSSQRRRSTGAKPADKSTSFRPLTTQGLISICSDPQLGFVISPENVGFDPLHHKHRGPWQDWNLYDCRHVRSPDPRA